MNLEEITRALKNLDAIPTSDLEFLVKTDTLVNLYRILEKEELDAPFNPEMLQKPSPKKNIYLSKLCTIRSVDLIAHEQSSDFI